MRRVLVAALLVAFAPGAVLAQDTGRNASDTAGDLAQGALPDRRPVVTRGVDLYGGDLQPLFDTGPDACQAACLGNAACAGFTFNAASRACFPKAELSAPRPFDGALSGRMVPVPQALRDRAADRRAALPVLSDDDIARARAEALALGLRHAGGDWAPADLLQAATEARARGMLADAIDWTGAALAQTDDPMLWVEYGALMTAHAAALPGYDDQQTFRDRALLAAINGWLRADETGARVTALSALASALEEQGRGRDTIPVLRLAQSIAPRPDLAARLDEMIAQHGFRIVEHSVAADLAAPRLCADFSEPLQRGRDYADYLRLPDPRLAVEAEDTRICVTGLEHGSRYTVTFRAGLPAADGEALARDVPISAYVRDRSPAVRFPGRAYVLPRGPDAGLPVETVNTGTLDLVLRRVSDRNLVRTLQEGYFARPLTQWQEEAFDFDIAEQIWSGTGETGNALNRDMTTRLPLGDVVGELPAGLYALSAAVPDAPDTARATQWFILSDIGLTTLQGRDGLSVIARGLGDAAPKAGLSVTLVSRGNRVLGEADTDDMGVARFGAGLMRGSGAAAPALVTARDGDADLAFLSLSDPAFDLSDRGVEGRAPAGPLDAFLTTDRGAYRAGDTIHATALLRDARAAAVPGVPLTAVLTRPDGVEHARLTANDDMAGGHVLSLPLDPSVPRGAWQLAVHADPEADPLAATTVLVEDFVPERIDFDLALPEGAIDPLAPPVLDIDARFLFGAPGAGLAIEGDVTLEAVTGLPDFPGYRFGRHDDPIDPRRMSLPSGLVTDDEGRAEIALPLPDLDPLGRPMRASATLRLSEASARPVERSIDRPVAPQGPVVGIRPEFDGVVPEGGEAGFDLIALGADLAPEPMDVRWTVNRVTIRYQWYEMWGNWNWEPVTSRETVAAGTARLGDAPVRVTAPVDWGGYEIVVERDGLPYAAASTAFEAGWYAPADAADSPDMLELSLDRTRYAPGDTATLRMVPRAAGTALVTVLADRVIAMQAVPVRAGENTVTLPVTEEWGAGVYVTAQVIRPGDAAGDRTPVRALGLAHAGVDPGARHLDVSLDAPEESAPRGMLTASLRVDGLPEGAQAFATVAAVDAGILNLTAFEAPDPAAHYFAQRRLGVEIRDLYGRLIDGRTGAMGQIRSGGDGAASVKMQAPPPTEELVALFSGPVTVGADGTATLAFAMPDFNGTVRLMAVAWSETGVGAAQADVLVRDPVVISAALPRFLSPGDETRLRLDLTHVKGAAGDMDLAVSAPGLTLGAVPDRVALTEGGRAAVEIPVAAGSPGDHAITVALTTPEGARLTRDLTLGVRATDPPVGTTRRLSLAPGQTLTLDDALFAGLRPGAEALISAGPLARIDAAGLMAALDRYPYGCTEQVASQAMPLLYLSSVAEALGIGDDGVSGDRTGTRIDGAIAQILSRQAANGAFGLWRAGSGDFWLDAYVTDFLTRARDAGHAVPDRALASALDNLAARLAYAPDFDRGGEDIAYALHVLAREGRAAMGDLRYYADEKAGAFGSALALGQLGAALASYGDQRRADALFAAAQARLGAPGPRVWRADYGSDRRDAAALLALAVDARSDAVDRDALMRRAAGDGGRASTQEQAWSLLAAHATIADPTVRELGLDGEPVAGPFARRHGAGDAPRRLTNTGTAPVPVTITTLGVPQGETRATGHGYAIERAYYTLDGVPADGPVTVGDRLVTVLTVRPAIDTPARLMIDDALPAGFEIDNPSLLRAGDIAALPWLQTAEVDHAEFRADRFLAAVTGEGAEAIRVAYMVRAVSPGTFHHPAALVEDMYNPDDRAVTASGRLTVLP